MRWRRGLFRIWIVISGLWIIGAFVIGFNSVADPRVHGRVVKLDPTLKRHKITSETVYAWRSSAPTAPVGFESVLVDFDDVRYSFQFPKGSLPNFKGSDWIKSVASAAQTDMEQRLQDKRFENVVTVLMASILPPAIVLAIGAAFAWAFSGFSRKNDVSETLASRLESDLSEAEDKHQS